MSERLKIDRVRFAEVKASEATTWTFVEVYDGEGTVATAEITCGGNTAEAVRLTSELVGRLRGREIADEGDVEGMLGLAVSDMQANMALATAVSGLRTAVSDLRAQRRGITLTEELGGTPQESVLLYANINRHLLTRDRSPASFGRAAELAVSRGFGIVKCAPFDGVGPPSTRGEILDVARVGIERVAAVRAAVGDDVTVLVDCHSRFERHTAPLVAEQLAKSNIGWFEEPVEPTKDAEGLAAIAREVSMITAGGESGYGREFLQGNCGMRRAECGYAGCEVLRRAGGGKGCGNRGYGCGRRCVAAQSVGAGVADWGRACDGGDAGGDTSGACGV
ncbi:D-gluconate/D-galactonate dehydratase [Geodia barretti]|uniref:D-gluconate/D-galactonate dehydratase n=1 Tax=Geodia barretti TaxID=519541 RepID=A0AA35TVS0_GEOBA|nr:D-gluconate/D-galactonate dehydratase [Geodia barretti]